MNATLKKILSRTNAVLKKILERLKVFLSVKRNRRLLYLVVIGLIALGDFLFSGLVRRTFVFYSYIGENTVVEDRLLHRSYNRETDIRRYVDEALLGPISPEVEPLFPRETRLNSFMYRGDVVYADLSEAAALPLSDTGTEVNEPADQEPPPLPQGGDVFRSLLTLNEGIRRNFSFVKDVRLFIGGNEVFFKEFRGFFADPADNSKTMP